MSARKAIPRGIHRIRVHGIPRPVAKDEIVVKKNRRGETIRTLIKQDYRTRKDPFTKQTVKYDHGYKAMWMNQVRLEVWRYMQSRDLLPYPDNHPVAYGSVFFVPQAASNKLIVPAQAPDLDNFDYAIWNALKRTTVGRGARGGAYPDGVLYWEDDQITWRPWSEGQIWATEENPPGVLITVASLEDVHHLMCEYDPYPKGST